MNDLFKQFKTTGYLHHAFVVVGGPEATLAALHKELEQCLGISCVGNPNIRTYTYTTLGVDEARTVASDQTQSGFGVGDTQRKIFIITAETLTREAQNALLKTFEEPTAGTHFFLLLPRTDTLLPTFLSRVLLVKGDNEDSKETALAHAFLNSNLEEKFTITKKLTTTKKDEPIDRELIRRFLDALEREISSASAVPSEQIRELYVVKSYMAERGSSPKMLLDHLAIRLS